MNQLRGLFTFILLSLAASVICQYQASNWPRFHQNNNNQGVSVGGGCNGLFKWAGFTKLGAIITSPPVVAADGTVYVGRDIGLMAFTPSGFEKWEADIGGVYGAPCIGPDGTIYVGTSEATTLSGNVGSGSIAAVNPDGSIKWGFKEPNAGSNLCTPSLGVDGTVYCGCSDGYFYALNPNGTLKWKFFTSSKYPQLVGGAAVGQDGTVYFGSPDGYVYSLAANGQLRWSFKTGTYTSVANRVVSTPAISPDGTLYVNTDFYFYALNLNGHIKWSVELGDNYFPWQQSSPAIGPDGTVYVGSCLKDPVNWVPSELYAYNPNGSLKWSFWAANAIDSSPAVGGDGTIYFGCDDDNVYAITPTGKLKWTFLTQNQVESSPGIAPDGTVYIGSDDGYIYAIGTQITTVPVSKISLSNSSVVGGQSTTATVTLKQAAPSVGDVVMLSTNHASAKMQTALFFPSGTTSQTFAIGSLGVASNLVATISATSGSETVQTNLTIHPATLIGISATSVNGGTASVGTVRLSGLTPPTGAVINLSSSDAAATVPKTVTIPAESQSITFAIKTTAEEATHQVTLSATFGGVTKSWSMSVYGDAISKLSFNPATLAGGASTTGTVTLASAAPPEGWLVNLKVDNATYIVIPASVKVAGGSMTANFPVKTNISSQNYTGTITASDALTAKAVVLSVTDDSLVGFTLSSAGILGGASVTGTLTLKVPAPAGGWMVKLSSSNTSVATVPASVSIPAGGTSGTFSITTKTVTSSTAVTLSAQDATSKLAARLTVNS
jgi:outer membrane protein assembly factor BamB